MTKAERYQSKGGGTPWTPPSGRGKPPPTPTPTCHCVARNGGTAAILVSLTWEKVPVVTNLDKNPTKADSRKSKVEVQKFKTYNKIKFL